MQKKFLISVPAGICRDDFGSVLNPVQFTWPCSSSVIFCTCFLITVTIFGRHGEAELAGVLIIVADLK